MTKVLRVANPQLKKFSLPQKARVQTTNGTTYEMISFIMEESSGATNGPALSPKELAALQKQYHGRQFKGWCMPEPPTGYIKPSKHDLL